MGQTFTVTYHPDVLKKDLPRLDLGWAKDIERAIETKLTDDPIHFGKPLRYSLKNVRALRVGDYRVAYTVRGSTVDVHIIGHRRSVYDEVRKRLAI